MQHEGGAVWLCFFLIVPVVIFFAERETKFFFETSTEFTLRFRKNYVGFFDPDGFFWLSIFPLHLLV